MSLAPVIQAAIRNSREGRVVGRKRLHKILYLLKLSGENVPADFHIHHYGPYSRDVADEAGWLSLLGDIEEKEEPLGVYGSNQYVYTLPENAKGIETPSPRFPKTMEILNGYSTIELEVASTIAYFEKELHYSHPEAIEATKEMKPSKTIPQVIQRAEKLLAEVSS